jgi:DNA replication protein DnaC
VGKTFLANALGHIAVRRHHSVHTERADKLFKRLRAARLDGSYEDEMPKLHRVEILIIDDLALHRLEATRPATSTSSSSNATAKPPPTSPATENPPRS